MRELETRRDGNRDLADSDDRTDIVTSVSARLRLSLSLSRGIFGRVANLPVLWVHIIHDLFVLSAVRLYTCIYIYIYTQ